ncbi:MAG TPA: hypothetical protein VFA46_10890 [Actinomycetes bacterium]|nr:hypothetical protein [Actinomycetes bacterium]
MTDRVPDYPEPLRAFRVWRLDVRLPEEAVLPGSSTRRLLSAVPTVLRSRNGLAMWRPGRNVAECRWYEYGPPSWPEKGPPAEFHDAPQRECGCGFYGAVTPPAPKMWSYWDDAGCHLLIHFYVSGLMEAWGRVIEHETGIRAQYARVIALLDPSEALGLGAPDADAVAPLIRRTAATYEAAYMAEPGHLPTIHAQGLKWLREHAAELEPASRAPARRPRQAPVALLPPVGVNPVSLDREEGYP